MNDEIKLTLTPAELDFIGTVLMQLQYGVVAKANMLHLLSKLQSQAQAQTSLD